MPALKLVVTDMDNTLYSWVDYIVPAVEAMVAAVCRSTGFPRIKVVQSLKALARRHNRSMEQEVRDLIEGYVAERRSVLDQIEAGWNKQTRRPTATEIDAWMGVGRP